MIFSIRHGLVIAALLLNNSLALAANPSLDQLPFYKKIRLARAGDVEAKMAEAKLEEAKIVEENLINAA